MGTIHLYFSPLWPLFLFLLNFGFAIPAAIHAVMTKNQVQSAIGWVAVIILSPFIGSILYLCFGINRVSRRWERLRRRGYKQAAAFFKRHPSAVELDSDVPNAAQLADSISPFPLANDNAIQILYGGAEAYPAMLEAIHNAKRMIALQSYIFDSGKTGDEFIAALAAAAKRGVEVRVLIDGFGAAYSRRSVLRRLRKEGIQAARFMEYYFGFSLPYANLRNHRKILIVDALVAFTGGMNIRDSFALPEDQRGFARDTHFRITGPVTDHLLAIFAQDWHFATHEEVSAQLWSKGGEQPVKGAAAARVIPSEPTDEGNANQWAISGALSRAKTRVMICSPYFIPSRDIIAMLKLVALRNVRVDIILPRKSNLFFVDFAARAQLDELIACGCTIWNANGPFDHSKLMIVDDDYAYIGSTNMDTRSLRLNFEVDLEVFHPRLVTDLQTVMDRTIASSTPVTVKSLKARPLPLRVFDRIIWLFSPYL